MEMDYNLKKLANFFKFFLCILEKSIKTDIISSSLEKSLNIFFMLAERFFVKYLSTLNQNRAKSPGKYPFKYKFFVNL